MHRAQMKVKDDLQKRRKKIHELEMAEQRKTNAEIEAIMSTVRFQLGKAVPMQLNNHNFDEEVADNIRQVTQATNPQLHSQMMAGGSRSRNQIFSNAFCHHMRTPPKLITADKQQYTVEYPPEDDSTAESANNLQQEEEKDLALILGTGLNLKKRREGKKLAEEDARTTKKAKIPFLSNKQSGYQNKNNSDYYQGDFSEAEEAGHPMPPTPK